MVGSTLVDIRERIESLASPDGTYLLVCGRTGDRPIPAVGHRFDSRATARRAARVTEQYRAALRRYDPQLPHCDIIVCERTKSHPVTARASERHPGERPPARDSPRDSAAAPGQQRDLVELCHRVAAAVFETLTEGGYRAVERAVMDRYFDLAESVTTRDGLCLCLVECLSLELDARLTPAERLDVVRDAATRLPSAAPTTNPVETTLSRLHSQGLFGRYGRSPWSVDLDRGVRSTDVHLSDYALSPHEGLLPVLPLVVDLYRRRPDWSLSSLRVVDVSGGWRLTLVLAGETVPTGVVTAPIQSEA